MNADTFLERLPEGAQEERAIVSTAFKIPDTIREKATAIRNNPRLSPMAQQDDIRAMVVDGPLKHLRQLRDRARAKTADVENRRKAIKLPTPDPTDMVAAYEREAMLRFLRTEVPAAERLRVVQNNPRMMEAVLMAPVPMMTGFSTESPDGGETASAFDIVRNSYLEAHYGEQLRDIQARAEVVDTLNAAIAVATIQFRNESGLAIEEIEQ